MVLRIGPNFSWMIAMGVKYHHTKFEHYTQGWRPGMGVTSSGLRFQNLSKKGGKCLFLGSLGAQHVLRGGHLHWNQPR